MTLPINEIICGDCVEVMDDMHERFGAFVHMCVTSPPYWGLRDYGIAPTKWPAISYRPMPGLPEVTIGAMECCLGLEKSPHAFVAHTVHVFRRVWQLLRDDGTLWLNLGDTYNSNSCGARDANRWPKQSRDDHTPENKPLSLSLKPKDLCGMPWQVAFALQADGWVLRQDVIWHKPNPMPESVRDRCTKAHEYIFLMTKSPKYFCDMEAIKEPASENTNLRVPVGWDTGEGSHKQLTGRHKNGNGKIAKAGQGIKSNESFDEAVRLPVTHRNKRSVWTVLPKAFKDAHFATFPPDLITPCILAGTSEKGRCSECGAPWVRITEKEQVKRPRKTETTTPCDDRSPSANSVAGISTKTTGWKASCQCGAAAVPCVVLDPFMGSGTTAEVAYNLGRDYVGCEISDEYKKFDRGERAKAKMALFESRAV